MKLLLVLPFQVPNPEASAEVLRAIDPPALPYFDGTARLTVSPWADVVERYLEAEGNEADSSPGPRSHVYDPLLERAHRRIDGIRNPFAQERLIRDLLTALEAELS